MREDKRRFKKVVKAEFDRQWREVIKNYPLVATAYIMQKKKYVGIAREQLPRVQGLGPLLNQEIEERVAIRVLLRLTTCFRNFERAIGRAQTDGEANDAFVGLGQCLRHKPD